MPINFDIIRAACRDELEKIAGELQGHTRVGRRPIGVDRLLERESESEVTPSDVVKLSAVPVKALAAGMAAGGALYHFGRKAEMDRRMGKAMRVQQQASSY
jgi:hypothetical protein